MGLSILITTVKERDEIAFDLIPGAVRHGEGGVAGHLRRPDSLQYLEQVIYSPEKDFFQNQVTSRRGDLLDLFCYLRGLKRDEGGPIFCEEFGLDLNYFRKKKELMNYIGFTPCDANRGLWMLFQKLLRIGKKQASQWNQEYGWNEQVLAKHKVILYKDGAEKRAVFTVYDNAGKVIGFEAINASCPVPLLKLGAQDSPPRLLIDPKLLNADYPVLLTNGYINPLCALSQGAEATSLIGLNGGAAPSTLLERFKGLEVVLAFPADERNQGKAMRLAEALYPIAKSVGFLKWPEAMGMPKSGGKTLKDYFLDFGGSLDSLDDIQAPYKSGEPLPLKRALDKPRDYPVDALPPVIRDAVIDVSEAMQCSPALPAQSFLAVSALSVQGYLDVMVDGRQYPTSCFFLTIAASGERKSSIDRIAMAPIMKLEAELRATEKDEMQEYRINMAVWQKQEREALRSPYPAKALRELGPPPEHPLSGSITTEEPTYEGLVKKMVNGQASMGIFSDEGGRFLGGAAMSKDNQQKTITGLSTIWDGRVISRTRAGDGSCELVGRRLSIHLMLQPVIADQLLNNQMSIDQGFLNRFLVTYPPSNIGNREYRSVNLKDSESLQRFAAIITEIHSLKIPLRTGTKNELEPIPITFTDEAMERWKKFYNDVESETGEGGHYSTISGFASKAAEYVARLASVLTFVDDPDAEVIPDQWTKSAIQIVTYHLSEARRLFNSCQESHELNLAQKCLDWLRGKYPVFSLQEIYQYGPTRVRNVKAATKIVKTLEQHGWVKPITGGAVIDYQKHKKAWKVVNAPTR